MINILSKYFFIAVVLLFSFDLNAQISGTIKDENNDSAIPFANVIALNFSDSTIVKAVLSSDNGSYKIEGLAKGKYLVKVVMLGYADYYSSPFNIFQDTSITVNCKIATSVENLESIDIVAKVPFIEQQAGKMVVNVSENISGVNGSMMDVMKKVPGVMVINKKISLAGNQNVTILINGKPTQYLDMQTLMSELPAEDIDKIEVVSQPDASMDATGTGGVINIILKKNRLSGTNGSINSSYGYGELAKYSFGATVNHRKDKFNVFGSGGYSYNTSVENMILDRKVGDATYYQETYQPYNPKTYRINAGIDYDVTDKQMTGLSISHLESVNNRTNKNNTTIEGLSTDTVYTLKTDNNINRKWSYNSANLYYNIELDTNGQKLDFSTNYGSYDNKKINTITTDASHDIYYPSQKNEEPGKTDIYAAKLDYTLPFSKKFKLNSGIKYSYANVNSDLRAFIENQGFGFVNNTGLSNHFIFKENIYAAYIKQGFTTKKISFETGLRYELSISEGYSVTIDSTVNRTISQLFPSAGINIPITKKLGTSLGYSYRIQRPQYSSLNPFISYLDPYTYQKGNTDLKPELTHSGKFSLTYEHQPFFNIEYNRTSDVLMFVTEQDDNTGVSYATTTNMKQYERFGASLFFPLNFIKPLEGYGGIMTYYHKYDAPYLDDIYNKEKFNYVLFIQASAEIIKTFKVETSGWYNSGTLEGIMESKALYGVSFGMSKTFFDKRLSLELSIDDAFFKYWIADIKYSNMDLNLTSTWETRVVYFKLTYKFGNRYLKKRKQQKNSAQEELNRASQKK